MTPAWVTIPTGIYAMGQNTTLKYNVWPGSLFILELWPRSQFKVESWPGGHNFKLNLYPGWQLNCDQLWPCHYSTWNDARRGGVEVAGWTLDRKIRVRFPYRVWALWWQGDKRRHRTSRCPCRGRLGTLKTPSYPWRWVPGSRSTFGIWRTVLSLYSWNIVYCDVKPQPTNQRGIMIWTTTKHGIRTQGQLQQGIVTCLALRVVDTNVV